MEAYDEPPMPHGKAVTTERVWPRKKTVQCLSKWVPINFPINEVPHCDSSNSKADRSVNAGWTAAVFGRCNDVKNHVAGALAGDRHIRVAARNSRRLDWCQRLHVDNHRMVLKDMGRLGIWQPGLSAVSTALKVDEAVLGCCFGGHSTFLHLG